MTCKYVSQNIGSYLDGELPGTEMLAIRSHLHDCPGCAAEAEALCSLKFELANLPCASAPADLEDRLLRAVRLEAGPVLSRKQIGLRWGSAVAAAACAGFAFMWFGVLGSGNKADAGLALESGRSNEAYEVSQDQAYATAADPLAGHGLVVTTSYEPNR
ncbi:MAG TPA: zf-HC2 domain-containing protein [Fimbriimonadaceae bacterium]|nr:zf-HC2 domain-containing protein [Fimbriimonadaceae bacterium]